MAGQDPTPDRPRPPAVWIIDEATELLVGRPQAGKTSEVAALVAQLAATGRRTGIVLTHPASGAVND